MASTYSNLKIELMGTGDQSGTWGTTTNTNLGTAIEEAITGTADVTFASADVTLTLTNTNTAQTARNLRLNLVGTVGAAQNLIVPAIEKQYIINNTLGFAITVKNSTGTGVAVPAGKSMIVFNTGSNVVETVTALGSGTVLPVANGGTGVTTSTGSTSVVLSNTPTIASPTLTGTATTSGTLAITGGLTLDGDAGSSGLALVSAGAGNTPTWGTLSVSGGGTGTTTLTGVIKGNGTSAFTAATAGTDYVAPGTATTFTAKQTFTGTSSVISSKFVNALEGVTVSATVATGTINYDVTTQSVLYYTSNASSNWTVNFRGSSGTSLNTAMAIGEAITVVFLVTQGATAYYNNAIQIDGVSVTPKYQGGTAWSLGYASGIDAYTYTIVKTGSATYTVFAAQTQFK
jgi:hypothetical protein